MAAKKKAGKPLEKQRRCSVCGLPGHTKTSHNKKPAKAPARKRVMRRNPTPATKILPRAFKRWLAAGSPSSSGKRVRRNLDGFMAGGFHPIRGSEGYSPILAGEDPYLDSVRSQPGPAAQRLAISIMTKESQIREGVGSSGRKLTAAGKATLKTELAGQRRRLVGMVRKAERKETEDQRRYEAQMKAAAGEYSASSLRQWKAEVKRAIKAVSPSGIAPHNRTRGGSALRTEYRLDVPIHLRNRRGLPLDEVADLLKRDYPHLGIEAEDDLLQALAA